MGSVSRFIKQYKTHFSFFYHCDSKYLLVPLYRCVPGVPVFYSLVAAEAADAVGVTGEVKAGPRQPLRRHLLREAGVAKRLQAAVEQRKVTAVVRLNTVVSSQIRHDGARWENAEWTPSSDASPANKTQSARNKGQREMPLFLHV